MKTTKEILEFIDKRVHDLQINKEINNELLLSKDCPPLKKRWHNKGD